MISRTFGNSIDNRIKNLFKKNTGVQKQCQALDKKEADLREALRLMVKYLKGKEGFDDIPQKLLDL